MNGTTNRYLIGTDTQTRDPVRIGEDALCNHVHILAGTGSGKTTLKKLLFQQVVAAGHGCLLMTPSPDGIWDALALVPQPRLADVILIDPADARFPYASNLLFCPNKQNTQEVVDAVNRLMHVFKKIWGPETRDASWGPQLENVLRNCLYALVLNDLTLAELPYLLRDGEFRDAVVSGIPAAYRWTPWFWQEDFNRWQERLQMERTDSTLNKVLEFLTNSLIEHIVGQQTNTLHLKRWINEEKIILIHLSENAPGLGDEAVKLLGTMLLAQIKEAIFARERIARQQRKIFCVLCDEFHLFAGDDFKTLLERARALNVPFIIGHQDMAQLLTEDLREAVNQTGNKVTGQVTVDDARQFAPLYAPDPKAEQIDERKTEDIAGWRPVRAYQRRIVNHLVYSQGHKDKRVTGFINDYLRELVFGEKKKVREDFDLGIYAINRLGAIFNPEMLPYTIEELNDWLYAGMAGESVLWQRLPSETYLYLSSYFRFGRSTGSWPPLKEQESIGWEEFRSADFLVEEAAYSRIRRDRLVNAAIAAIEAAFFDFLRSLFPFQTQASFREAWSETGQPVPSFSLPQLQVLADRACERITAVLLNEARQETPGMDASLYIRRFLEELSKPKNAVAVFLPALYNAYGGISWYVKETNRYVPEVEWRTITGFTSAGAPFRAELPFETGIDLFSPKFLVNTTPNYTYQLELFTDNIRLRLIRIMRNCLPPFLGMLRFAASLNTTQLALAQNPVWTLSSGQYEPDIRTSTHFLTTPRQSPPEVAGLMEGELLNLEPLTAWCRVQNLSAPPGEKIKKHKIHIPFPTPLVTGQAQAKRIEAVRQQSRALIAPRPASVVEAEMRGRVALLRKAAAEKEVPTRTNKGKGQDQRMSRRASEADAEPTQ